MFNKTFTLLILAASSSAFTTRPNPKVDRVPSTQIPMNTGSPLTQLSMVRLVSIRNDANDKIQQ